MRKISPPSAFSPQTVLPVASRHSNYAILAQKHIYISYICCCWLLIGVGVLEVNADKTQYIVMSRDQNAAQSHSMRINNSSFERVEEFKYLGTNLTSQNSIQEEIKSKLKSDKAFYHSVQNLLSSSLLSKNSKIQIYRTMYVCMHVACMGRGGVYGVLVGEPEEKRPLGRPRHRWEDNMEMDLQEVACGSIDWIELAQDRDRWLALVHAVMNFQVP